MTTRSALLVVAHPCADSFCRVLAGTAERALTSAGASVVRIDLDDEGFRAAMSSDERRAYDTDAPIVDDSVRAHAELVMTADTIVFVYPTWWSGPPAILKGWLERVLVPGVGFVFDERSGKVRPGLRHVRRVVGISTYGSPRWTVKLTNDNGRRILTRALRLSCGWRVRTTWLGLYGMDGATRGRRAAFVSKVARTLQGL